MENQSEDKSASPEVDWKSATTIFGFNVKNINGESVSLSKYKGSVVLIVNVASQCGLTPGNYQSLNELHSKYHKDGLNILAFPCNQFGGQEPGDSQEICQFVAKKDVHFDLFAKIDVNGDKADPLFKFLKSKLHGTLTNAVKWNFTKFLVGKDGKPVKRYAPTTDPLEIEGKIKELLQQ